MRIYVVVEECSAQSDSLTVLHGAYTTRELADIAAHNAGKNMDEDNPSYFTVYETQLHT